MCDSKGWRSREGAGWRSREPGAGGNVMGYYCARCHKGINWAGRMQLPLAITRALAPSRVGRHLMLSTLYYTCLAPLCTAHLTTFCYNLILLKNNEPTTRLTGLLNNSLRICFSNDVFYSLVVYFRVHIIPFFFKKIFKFDVSYLGY